MRSDGTKFRTAAISVLHVLVLHFVLLPFAFLLLPSFATISYSDFVTGCTDNRLPFFVTTICSRPFVDFSVSSGTISGNRSTNAMSTMYQMGGLPTLSGSKYLCPFLPAKTSG